ncbi:MAG: 3D domain-containing protein [Blautia sp.]|nr:3D domain-containing protein [Blautia sp.]
MRRFCVRWKRALGWLLSLSLMVTFAGKVLADVKDYGTIYGEQFSCYGEVYTYPVNDGAGALVNEIPLQETVYVAQKELYLYPSPNGGLAPMAKYLFGAQLTRLGICENGFSHVLLQGKSSTYEGYVQTWGLSDIPLLTKMDTSVTIQEATQILDYPSLRDGDVIGEAYVSQVLPCTGVLQGNAWTRVTYTASNGVPQSGYVMTTSVTERAPTEANGTLSRGSGIGVFSDATTQVTQTGGSSTSTTGVLVGSPEMLGQSVNLKSLGVFRITHYCSCSICCGPYADGITSTGGTAVTNRTIAVSPSQIPYGSRVAINGQVYVAEDCGGAIKDYCIDVYVASHAEALARGVFYSEVFLIQ